ncbi:hypothetical protein LC55x_1632 [Lysobacter capsici]|uniref:hypothetical protein n=1 Tax=Lysobacter capsici TaxID=435897 RepID=UPI0007165FEA|nr:hypothetical protein [Lysobacter capsici]ALN84922.1 hypothetical protein LC55x_1632 [Lysobacter capsici]
MNASAELHIFIVGDEEWWTAHTADELLDVLSVEWSMKRDEILEQYGEPQQLTDETLDSHQYIEQATGTKRSFREQLARQVAEGGEFPRMFACVDW